MQKLLMLNFVDTTGGAFTAASVQDEGTVTATSEGSGLSILALLTAVTV
jgi:hypothetical protein